MEKIEYKLKENGKIDWLRMCPEKHVYLKPCKPEVQKEIETLYNKPFDDIKPFEDNVDEKYLTVALAGLRVIAKARGFHRLEFDIKSATPDYAAVKCSIFWDNNTNVASDLFTRQDCACATPETTNFMTKNYLVETACNRAEARVIRNSLEINVVSREEMAGTKNPEEEDSSKKSISDPRTVTERKIKELGFKTFIEARTALNKINVTEFDAFEKLADVPKEKLMTLIGVLSRVNK